ncbi:hypothetical protein Tco_1569021 [Tanacetum coccineum]
MEEDHSINVIEVTKLIDLNKQIVKQENEVESNGDNVLPEVTDADTVMEEVTKCMKTPRATLYEHNETPGGSIYWELHVQGIPIPVEGTYYDTIDETIDMYTKYADMAGFEVKKSGQMLTKSGAVQHKYIMCNREGVPKGINVDTLDPEYCDKPKRNTTTHVENVELGCHVLGDELAPNATTRMDDERPLSRLTSKKNHSSKVSQASGATLVSCHDVNMKINVHLQWKGKYLARDIRLQVRTAVAVSKFEYKGFKNYEGCETVIIRDKKPNDNRSLFYKKGKEQEKKTRTVAEAGRDYKIWGKNLTIERLTNEANFLVDDCLLLLSKDEGRMETYVEKLKKLLDEVKADMPNPPSRNTGDAIGGIFSISKPIQVDVKNPTKAVNKGEHLKKGERLKSEREKSIKVRAKKNEGLWLP